MVTLYTLVILRGQHSSSCILLGNTSLRKAKNWIDFSTLLRHEYTANVQLVTPVSHLHSLLSISFCAVSKKETCIGCKYWQVRLIRRTFWMAKVWRCLETFIWEIVEGTQEVWPEKRIIKGDIIIFFKYMEPESGIGTMSWCGVTDALWPSGHLGIDQQVWERCLKEPLSTFAAPERTLCYRASDNCQE